MECHAAEPKGPGPYPMDWRVAREPPCARAIVGSISPGGVTDATTASGQIGIRGGATSNAARPAEGRRNRQT